MARDIKKMFEDYTAAPEQLPLGHQARFEAKLNKAFSQPISEEQNTSIPWLKIAAVAVVFIAVSFFGYQQLSKTGENVMGEQQELVIENNTDNTSETNAPQLTLADISPDLKKVQDYYMTGINMQLASLKIDEENKEVVDGYMQRLAELDKEYASLNAELNKIGPSEATVTAMIDNLKIRLDLLFKLKSKLKELKNQNNEEFKVIRT